MVAIFIYLFFFILIGLGLFTFYIGYIKEMKNPYRGKDIRKDEEGK